MTRLNDYGASAYRTVPKHSLLTEKTKTIEELAVHHERLQISKYVEPTNEQSPYRPRFSQKGLTRDVLRRRVE